MSGVTFVEERPMEGREIEAVPGAVIGREGCDIVLADPEVSRRHAAIRQHAEGIAIEDLGSTNGTYINDQRLTGQQTLRDGDTVRFGNTVWRVRAGTGAPATQLGQIPAGDATMARPMPEMPAEPPTAPQPAAPAPEPVAAPQATTAMSPPAAQAPARPAEPSPASVGQRGDVPAPPDVAPSAIRRVLPSPGAGQAPAFTPPGARNITTKRGSAATRVEATIVCLLIVLAVAVAVVVYFATR